MKIVRGKIGRLVYTLLVQHKHIFRISLKINIKNKHTEMGQSKATSKLYGTETHTQTKKYHFDKKN